MASTKGRKVVEKKAKALARLKVKYVPTASIRPNAYNPNRQSEEEFDLLVRAIEEEGFTEAILVHKGTGEIIDGEHRWRAARKMGMEEVPVVFADMAEEQRRISTLRHNRARGSEDAELSSQVMRDLRELGALEKAAQSLGLDDAEIARLVDDVPAAEVLAGEDYSEAWAPTRAVADRQTEGGESSLTEEARAEMADVRARMAAASGDAERMSLEQQMRRTVLRIVAVFHEEEAELVRGVLGAQPAEMLLKLCRQRLADAA